MCRREGAGAGWSTRVTSRAQPPPLALKLWLHIGVVACLGLANKAGAPAWGDESRSVQCSLGSQGFRAGAPVWAGSQHAGCHDGAPEAKGSHWWLLEGRFPGELLGGWMAQSSLVAPVGVPRMQKPPLSYTVVWVSSPPQSTPRQLDQKGQSCSGPQLWRPWFWRGPVAAGPMVRQLVVRSPSRARPAHLRASWEQRESDLGPPEQHPHSEAEGKGPQSPSRTPS